MSNPVDRFGLLQGQNRTLRDSRVPFTQPRAILNYGLPDGRCRRRSGFSSYSQRVVAQAVAKATGTSITKRLPERALVVTEQFATPLSYGVIKWQDDFQLKTTRSMSFEFSLLVGEKEHHIRTPLDRIATVLNPAPFSLRTNGVYVLDKTIFANQVNYETGLINKVDGSVTAGTNTALTPLTANRQCLPLVAMAVKYSLTQIRFEFMMINSTNDRYMKAEDLVFSFAGGSYNVGDLYHIAIVHKHDDGANGTIKMYVNGTLADTFVLPVSDWKFCGQYDRINGITYATGQTRDIVILNEAIARASYQSTVKVTNVVPGNQAYSPAQTPNTQETGPILANCPPAGTAMWDLRFWQEARTALQVSDNANRRIFKTDSGLTNLKGNWHMDDGGPICVNNVSGKELRYLCLHHGYPGYVDIPDMINDVGLKFGDGQHAIISTDSILSKAAGRTLQTYLSKIFEWVDLIGAGGVGAGQFSGQHAFTIQMQIMVPEGHFQTELNDHSAALNNLIDLDGTETRKSVETAIITQLPHRLLDGFPESTGNPRRPMSANVLPGSTQYNRAYDQTLWSIEGTQLPGPTSVSDEHFRRRIPVARGLINPSGRVVFELYRDFNAASPTPQLLRLVATDPLIANKVYTITFVHRATYSGGNPTGQQLRIFIKNITDGTATVVKTFSRSDAVHTTFSCAHHPNYDITIGASYVRDSWDWGINEPTGNAFTTFTSTFTGGGGRGDHGPWPVTQRYLSPYQDQPGNFICGMFRMWSSQLTPEQIETYQGAIISPQEYTSSLLLNVEFEEVSGTKLRSKSRFNEVFDLGFKSWGMVQGTGVRFIPTAIGDAVRLMTPSYDLAWNGEDCLGYTPIFANTSPAKYNSRQINSKVTGLIPYKSDIGQQFGVVAAYDASLARDKALSGVFNRLDIKNHGLLNDISPNGIWRGTTIGDKTILTSLAGIPKVYDGIQCTVAGFKRWSGGQPLAYRDDTTSNLVTGIYGVVVVYFDEKSNIYHISPVAIVNLAANASIEIYHVPPHPDPRVSQIRVYRTVGGLPTEALARSAPLFLATDPLPNMFTEVITLNVADANIPGTLLDTNVTPMPNAAYTAVMNESLFLTGDVLNPNIVYFTDKTNPQQIDALLNNFILPESTTDAPNGLISAFGALFVFKPNVIWRVDEVGPGQFQKTKIANVGPVSDQSLEVAVNPDTGRVFIFFWSQHGPYILDGRSVQYIGQPVEEPTRIGATVNPYWWLDPLSVVVGHSQDTREIICFYKPVHFVAGNPVTRPIRAEAVVFNYRYSAWYRFIGTIANCAASASFTGDSRFTNPKATVGLLSELIKTQRYITLVGGDNGAIYEFGKGTTDGLPLTFTFANSYTISAISSQTYTLTGLSSTGFDFSGCWAIFIQALTNKIVIAPILENTGGNIVIDANWQAMFSTEFTPLVNDTVRLFQPHALVEFAWDELEIPFLDKQVIELIVWHNGDLYYRTARDYDEVTKDARWTKILDNNSQRSRTIINKKLEALKLEIMALDPQSTFDGHVFMIQPTTGANTKQ